MPDQGRRKPPVILHATITLDGKLAVGAPLQTVRGAQVETLDPTQCRALLVSGVVNEIHLTIRPRIDGHRDSPTLSGPPTPEFFPRSLACRLLRMETRDGECLLHYRVLRRARAAARPR